MGISGMDSWVDGNPLVGLKKLGVLACFLFSKKWNLKSIAFHRTSNTALIYCEGFCNKDHYLLLGFIERAHETYKEKPLLLLELSDIADRFREKF